MTTPTERTVCYIMSYSAHCPYLATSLLTLRRCWSGRVKVFAWAESIEIVRQLCEDKRIEAEAVLIVPSYRGKNDQFICKIQTMRQQETGPNLYLDADTLVNGSLTELFSNAQYFGFAATQFCDWTTEGNLIRGRINRLKEFPKIDASLVDEVTTNIHPSVNGGVFACMPDSPVLPIWHEWSYEARSIFICDECVLHLLVPMFEPTERMTVLPGIFNSSPKYVPQTETSRVRVWHGHGDCWVRPAKSREGWSMWHAQLQEVRRLNLGNIESWFRLVGNKYLDELIANGELG